MSDPTGMTRTRITAFAAVAAAGLFLVVAPNEDVRNLVRAVTHPYPGAFAFAGTGRVRIWWTQHAGAQRNSDAPPGHVRHAGADVLVTCADGRSLRLVTFDVNGLDAGPDPRGALSEGTVLTSHPSRGAS